MADPRPADARPSRRPSVPRSFQTRLTFAFIGVVALTLALVAPIVINRIDDYVRQQEEQSLRARAKATAVVIDQVIKTRVGNAAIVGVDADGQPVLRSEVRDLLVNSDLLTAAADNVALADVSVMFGPATQDTDGTWMPDPDKRLAFTGQLDVAPIRGQARDPQISPARWPMAVLDSDPPWGMVVTLSNPYTARSTTLAAITGLVLVMAGIAFGVAVLVAAFLAHRFTTPLTRLTEASRRLAEGDLSSRVPADEVASSTTELRALSMQFNQMADRLEQSVVDHPPRPRLQPRLPGRREPRAPDADRGDAHVRRAAPGPGRPGPGGPLRVPRTRPPSSSTGSTGWPRTCSSSRSSTRASSCSTCARTTCAGPSSRPSSSSRRRRSARASA